MKKKHISMIIAAIVMASINSMNVLAAENTTTEVVENVEENNTFLNLESNMNRTHLKENFTVDLNIDTTKEIFATEITIKYDNSKLSFLGFDEVEGIALSGYNDNNGEITFALASLGDKNSIVGKSTLIKMNFTGIAPEDAAISITKAEVADTLNQRKLTHKECGKTTINICNRELISVNKSDNEFTLLDLSIIAYHYGEDPEELLKQGIDADLNLDGKIDEADAYKCGDLIAQNPNDDFWK